MLTLACVLQMGLAAAGPLPEGKAYENTVGMRLVRIEPGEFEMGFSGEPALSEEVAGKPWRVTGNYDERPVRRVTISKPFFLGACEVTNAQYEQFDPLHRSLRGKLGLSMEDDEAVVFVSWHDAVRFCEWLSKKEGLPYRLPTEAEWEYACRAGTVAAYHTGDVLPEANLRNPGQWWHPDTVHLPQPFPYVSLHTGKTEPNAWGLYDMHGNVEEWCQDWYGRYPEHAQTDPVGPSGGDFKVARGGSHSTFAYYLRSANRAGTLPEDCSWVIGFRVVLGAMPDTAPTAAPAPELWGQDVRQDTRVAAAPETPVFKGPRQYVKIPADAMGPMYAKHNHCPAIVSCPNGDLLAIWYTCMEEPGRELGILASRLRAGHEEWEPATPFWDAPCRNDHASALFYDGDKTLYHFNGLSVGATWGSLATILRTSTDSGATWTPARLIIPEHGMRHMPIESVFRTKEGAILLPCDAVTGGQGGTAVHLSYDEGKTWADAGGTIAGIHAGVVQLQDGRLMAFGRGDNIDDRMPMSISEDMGKTWTYSATEFAPITGSQRLVLLRLKEGPIFFASFDEAFTFTDAAGVTRTGSGLYGALSFDDGKSWPVRRLITDDGSGRELEWMDGKPFVMDKNHAEPRGYMSVCQDAAGMIHLISSRQHYAFNLAWLKTPPPAE